QAYNDWLHDYCEVCPSRLKGVGLVALQDVQGAIAEMHRAVSRLHMVAIQIGCTVREDTLLSDPRLTDFWAEADRLGVPIAVHGPALPSLFRSYFDLNRPDHMLEASHMAHTFAQMLACSNIVTSGLLERFRNLKVAFLEAGAGWVPYWMHRMDEYNEVAPERWAHISAKPSEYVKCGRVFFSCEPGDEFIPFFIDHVGEDAMLFASDYLHFDALFVGEPGHDGQPYPGTVATLLGRKDVPDSAKRKMLLDNSLNFYSMDKAKLGRRGMPVAGMRFVKVMFWLTMHPSRNASTRRGTATPAFAPRVRHSASSRSMLMASALWTSLVTEPAPSSPTHTTLRENVSSTGFTRRKTASSPPTNSVSCPSSAPSRPPSRGASSSCAPRACMATPTSRTTPGALVVWSITADPGLRPSSTPLGPSITACISGGPGTHVQITSHWVVRSRGDSAQSAPRSRSVAAASLLMSWTTSGNPALSTKPASGSPMFPRPMNPTRIASSLL